ncbi:hypothetical protein GFY24_06060 [Nocardia sp. SYP-A9097]|uniref:hypothetical protein n=1 Tax=Nocardia sp. SYP-A9097 TaxID=2663237 RepID=UPI00129BE77C|nr:hypothetical protein [Nocardia sp. SYP-A9097]MRH87035.1 hypothetical protein [Nocardia sp. SYP-A9097]
MKPVSFALLAVTPLLITGLVACGSSSDSAKSTTAAAKPTTAAATTTGQPTPPPVSSTLSPNPTRPSVPPTPLPTTTVPPTTTGAAPIDNSDCGTVTDAGGGTRTVIAVGTPAGRVGCTEAINVATQYVQTISDSDVATVNGWSCNAQPDAQVPSMCAKDGLLINLLAD